MRGKKARGASVMSEMVAGSKYASAVPAWFACAGVPMVAVGAYWSLSQPFAAPYVQCGTLDVGLPFMLALVGFMGSVTSIPIAIVLSRLPRAAIAVAAAVVAASMAIAALGVRSLSRPEPDAFLGLFDHATLDPGELATLGETTFDYGAKAPCRLSVTRAYVVEEVLIDAVDVCPRLEVHRDPATERVVVSDGRGLAYASDELTARDLRGRLGAPRDWVGVAIAGSLLAFVALAIALRSRARLDGAFETTHAGGWITIDGAPRFAPELVQSAPGPVVIVPHERARAATYRDDGGAKIFKTIPGTLASLRDSARMRAATWAFVAIAAAATTSAPLWIARVFGLL